MHLDRAVPGIAGGVGDNPCRPHDGRCLARVPGRTPLGSLPDSGATPADLRRRHHAGADLPVDLDACAREPIHLLGRVQSHGALLALDAAGIVRQCSRNIGDFLRQGPAQVLGRPLVDLVGARVAGWVAVNAKEGIGRLPVCRLYRPGRDREMLWLSAYRHDGRLMVEFERPTVDAPAKAPAHPATDTLKAIRRESGLFRACQLAADAVHALSGYHRVLVYMFHPDQTGEVVAEVRPGSAVGYLGLRYPASDIPHQARRLYLDCLVRQVVNVGDLSVPVEPLVDPATGRPLDLGLAQLRTLSAAHMEYLTNMGVAATLTASVVVEGRLWGLIACHHNRPKWLPPPTRAAVLEVARALAASVTRATGLEERRARREAQRQSRRFARILAQSDNPAETLLMSRQGLLNTVSAGGVALMVGDDVLATGATPGIDWLRRFARLLAERQAAGVTTGAASGVFATDCLSRDLPEMGGPKPLASGVAATVMDSDRPGVLALFAGEVSGTVNWGGNPERPAEWDVGRGRLTPRKSFELWKTLLTGHSRPWSEADLYLLESVGGMLATDVADGGARLAAEIDDLSLRLGRDRHMRREILDALLDGIVLIASVRDDLHMNIHSVNKLFREAFGVPAESRLPKRLDEFLERFGLPAELADPAFSAFPLVREVWCQQSGRRWFSFDRRNVYAVQGRRGSAKLSMICFYDITTYKQAEEALLAARMQAEGAVERQRQFIAAASHELRTPLNAIIGFSEMIQEQFFGPIGDRRYTEFVGDILTAGRHLLALINDILTLGQLQRGAMPVDQVRVDVAEEIDQCLRLVEEQARAREVRIVREPSESPAWLDADGRAVRQILLNLLSNGIKFTPKDGRVACTFGSTADGEIWLQVADSGIGISDHDLEHVFEPFFRAGNVYTRSTEGTGLGLSIVKALTEAHGGQVMLSSRYGQGTTVRITFPAWRSHFLAPTRPHDAPSGPATGTGQEPPRVPSPVPADGAIPVVRLPPATTAGPARPARRAL